MLARPVVIGTIRNNGVQSISLVVTPDQEVGRGLGGTVGTVGRVRAGFREASLIPKTAKNLIGRNMMEPTGSIGVGVSGPKRSDRLKQGKGPVDIGLDKRFRTVYAIVHMRLRCKMEYALDPVGRKQILEQRTVPDIALDKYMPGVLFKGPQVFPAPGIGEVVEVYDLYLRKLSQKV